MLTNFHTHTTFCDGKNTPEEVIKEAISQGFDAIGFSSHGYTEYDLRYCMKDARAYISEIVRLKEKYSNKIEIYLGIEEDSRHINNRADFDYIIGSCHYVEKNGIIKPLDSGKVPSDYFEKALLLFDNDELLLAEHYYSHFTEYIQSRKPDIIGHFDLVTKFDEMGLDIYLNNEKYWAIAEKYTRIAARAGSFFELNTGLISRGYRSAPCPHPRLLKIIKDEGAGIVLSADSHAKETLRSGFDEAKKLLSDIGFDFTYTLKNGAWVKDYI